MLALLLANPQFIRLLQQFDVAKMLRIDGLGK